SRVHFRGSPAEQFRRRKKLTDQLSPGLGGDRFSGIERGRRQGINQGLYALFFEGKGPLIEAPQLIERITPCVALIWHESLEDGQRARLFVIGPVLDSPGQLRRMQKLEPIGEVASDLKVGVGAGFQAAEQLENETVAEDGGAVGLLDVADAHGQRLKFGGR